MTRETKNLLKLAGALGISLALFALISIGVQQVGPQPKGVIEASVVH
jgi:hypothetical protein